MTSSVAFYAAEQDYAALRDYAEKIGLTLVAAAYDMELPEDPSRMPFCYLSPMPKSELHPYGKLPVVGDATDPLLAFARPYYKEPYLVAGYIQMTTGHKDLARIKKPYFQKLAAWIRKEWTLLPGGGLYIGPQAHRLSAAGAERVNALPGTATFTVKEV